METSKPGHRRNEGRGKEKKKELHMQESNEKILYLRKGKGLESFLCDEVKWVTFLGKNARRESRGESVGG